MGRHSEQESDQRKRQLDREIEQRRADLQARLERLKARGEGNGAEATRIEGLLRDFERKRKVVWSEVSESVIAEMRDWLDKSP